MKTVLDEITEIMRECDDKFQSIGGSTRHYVIDLFLPTLEDKGFILIKIDSPRKLEIDTYEVRKELTLKLREKGYSMRQIQRALTIDKARKLIEP